MMKEITLKLQDNDLQKLMDFLKTLGSVQDFKSKEIIDFPTMNEKQIIDRVKTTNNEIKDGKFTSQEDLKKDFESW